jgi:hypothetical protein
MDNEDRLLEDNIARLIRAGYGPEVRPNARVRERVFARLASQVRSGSAAAEFPASIIGLLFGALGLMAIWLAAPMIGVAARVTSVPSIAIVSAVLLVNLVSVPVAAIIIVIRRRYAQI